MIQLGDSINLLKSIPDGSVDALITDPPYGISFMNKDWDKFNEITDITDQGAYGKEKGFKTLPRNKPFGMLKFFVPIWKEAIRVLKPGAFAFVMCSPRQDVLAQQILALSEAGFNTGYSSIYWGFASGFPKAQNVSKAVDRKLGYEREVTAIKQSNGKRDSNIYQLNNQGLPDKYEFEMKDKPVSEQAKSLNGAYSGFQPKPAVEIILVAMKPLSEKTYVEQAMKNGKGITWLDSGRIPFVSNNDKNNATQLGKSFEGTKSDIGLYKYGSPARSLYDIKEGRFPANLLVSDDVLNDGKSWKSGGSVSGNEPSEPTDQIYGKFHGREKFDSYGDEGSFSRYFDLDAWYSKNVESLPDYVQRVFPFLIVPKPTIGEKNKGIEQFDEVAVDDGRNKPIDNPFLRGETLRKNIHPTVKPVKLMSYLVSIATRPKDTVLDPFMGSGTTGVACKILDRNFIGFEMKKEYFEIAERRIDGIPESVESYEVDE